MSCVRKDEFYRFLDMTKYGWAAGDCFWSKENVTIDTRYDEKNPTIRLGVSEIRQAPATIERKPMREDTTERKQVEDATRPLCREDLESEWPPIDPVAKHELLLTGDLGDVIEESVPPFSVPDSGVEVFGRLHRTGKFDTDAEDVDFKE